jgi:hypothetical protein
MTRNLPEQDLSEQDRGESKGAGLRVLERNGDAALLG